MRAPRLFVARPLRSCLGNSVLATRLLWASAMGLSLYANGALAMSETEGAQSKEPSTPAAGTAPDRAAQKWIAQLADGGYTVRKQAYEALKSIGRPALEPLTGALEATDPEVRTRAAQLLVEMRGRGFMGIQLQEDWDGDDPFQGVNRNVDDGGVDDPPAANEPPREEVKAKPPPRVLAASVLHAKDMDPEVQQMLKGQEMPAGKAGVADGDRILAVNGRPIRGVGDLLREVTLAGPRTKTMIVVERSGKKVTLAVTLTRNPSDKSASVDLLAEDAGAAAEETERPRGNGGHTFEIPVLK